MVVFKRHSIDFLEMNISPSSFFDRLPQKLRKKLETKSRDQADLPFVASDDEGGDDVLNFRETKASLEHRARAFFKLAKVNDRKESRYNAHGNRGSFHGQKNKVYKNVFSGTEVIDSMVASGLAASREAALLIGNKLSTEMNLFSRANPRSWNGNKPCGRPGKSRGKDKANLLAAQTILLGSACDNLDFDSADDRGVSAISAPGCFVDDINAFYRFGPGVLEILRGIDGDDGTKDEKPPKKMENLAPVSAEESSYGSSDEDYQKKKKKNFKDTNEKSIAEVKTKSPERNLSLVPNAPGCNGKIILEDLFLLRHPEMKARSNETTKATTDASSTQANRNGKTKIASKTSSKKTKKTSSDADPSPFPKPILKNSNCNNNNSKTKKKKTIKTKGSHKKTTRKFKAGEKIKYVSNKERKIATIEKRLSAYHSDHQIALYRQMLKELENRISLLYTGDHIEIISLSSHSTYPASPKKENFVSVIDNVSEEEKSLANNSSNIAIGASNNVYDTERKRVPDETYESLDDIVTNNADLLANADDSASVWTEFIMGTSRNDYKESHDGEKVLHDIREEETKAETPNTKALSKDVVNKGCLPKVAETQEAELETSFIEKLRRQQPKQQREIQRPTGWHAPAPLECGGCNDKSNNDNKTCRRVNEIDLSSSDTAKNNLETKESDCADWTKNSFVLCQTATIGENQISNFSSKNGIDFAFNHGITSDDLSVLLEQQQEKEFQSLRIYDRGVSCGSTNHRCEERGPNTNPATKKSGTKLYSVDSVVSNTTKDSNDLTKLRIVPFYQKKNKGAISSNQSKRETITEGGESRDRGTKTRDHESEYPSTPTPSSIDEDCSRDCDESGIMDAIEQDPFYQQAVRANDSNATISTVDSLRNDNVGGFDASPGQSEPGSFTASFNERHSFDEFDGDGATIDTYSDEGSYMELTVGDDEIPCEEFEEEIIEEDLYDEVTVLSEVNNQPTSPRTIGSRPTLSPRRKSAQFRSSTYLSSVPELGPEPEPEPEPQPTSPKRENSVYVEVHSMADDDEMTQITMDCFLSAGFQSNRSLHIIPEDDYSINNGDYSNHNSYLLPLREGNEVNSENNVRISPVRNRNSRMMKKVSTPTRPKNRFSAQQQLKKRTKYQDSLTQLGRPCNTILHTETSQQRIQEISWKDLPSSDVTVAWSALEELQILVANESRSRAYLVRHGGVMVIIDTMAEQVEVEVIQFLCCNILEQLASLDFEIGLTILELGGVSLIEESMAKHSNSDRVKKAGDAALRALLQTS